VLAARIRFRAELRSRWRAWALLALAAGLAGGLIVGMVAAAQRTETTFDRFLTHINAADAYVGRGFGVGEDSLDFDRIARLPQVARTQRQLLLAVIARSRSGRPFYPNGPHSLEVQVPSDGRRVDSIDRAKLLRGRLPNSSSPNEMLADTKSMHDLGIGLGDWVTMRVLSRDTLWDDPQATVPFSVDPRKASGGPLVRLRVVGVEAFWKSDLESGYLFLTPAFYRAHGGGQLGSWLEELEVRLKRGAADLPAFRAGVHRIAGHLTYAFFDPSASLPKVQRSIDLQAQALRLLSAFGAAAALLLVGQALFRQATHEAGAHPILRALGMTSRELMLVSALRAVVIAVPAALLAALSAFALSPLAPIGHARDLEPDPGFVFDSTVIITGAGIVFTVVLAMALLASARVVRRRTVGPDRPRSLRHPPPASLLVRAGWPPPVVTGVHMALDRRNRASAVPVGATLVAAILAAGVAATAVTFAASLSRLLDTPALYGQTWDFETGNIGPPLPSDQVRGVTADPMFSGVGVGMSRPIEIGDREVGARAIDSVKGSIVPTVLEGRAPRRPGEVLLGAKTFDALHRDLGDVIVVHNGRHAVRLRVVGRGVLPATKWNKLDEGAAFSFQDLKRIDPTAEANLIEVRFAPDVDRAAALRRLSQILESPSEASRPTDIGDFGGVEALPSLIMAVFIAAAAAALAHALVTSIRRRRRDLAILKTIGFTRRQVAAAVAWHATTVAAIGVLVGLPLGLAVGRFTWNVFAEDLGVVPDVVTPVPVVAAAIPAGILLANLIAVLPGWNAARTRPAIVLRAE
jgi:putative ABC transport system permease protein